MKSPILINRRCAAVALPSFAMTLVSGCSQTPPAPPAASTAANAAPAWTDKPVFSIVDIQIHDPKGFGEYVAGHTVTVAHAGGRFLVAGARAEAIEGSRPARNMVVHQWPNARIFLDWYNSAAYAQWKPKRLAASSANVLLVQGLSDSPPSPALSPGFTVVDIEVRDGQAFARYVQGHMESLRAAGGQFLAAGGRIEVIEGDWTPRRVILHRWPTSKAFRDWYASDAYRPWRDLRHSASSATVLLAAGLSEAQKAERKLP